MANSKFLSVQIENSTLRRMDMGKLLLMAVDVRKKLKENNSPIDKADTMLSKKIKAGCIQGRYATDVALLTVEQKAEILDYIFEYHTDFDYIANKVLENFD